MSDLDALVAALGGEAARVYKRGAVPPKPTFPYRVLTLSPDAPRVRTLDGSGDLEGRFNVQHFGRTADSVGEIADHTFATFDGNPLPLPGEPVAVLDMAPGVFRDPDDRGVLDLLHTYRY